MHSANCLHRPKMTALRRPKVALSFATCLLIAILSTMTAAMPCHRSRAQQWNWANAQRERNQQGQRSDEEPSRRQFQAPFVPLAPQAVPFSSSNTAPEREDPPTMTSTTTPAPMYTPASDVSSSDSDAADAPTRTMNSDTAPAPAPSPRPNRNTGGSGGSGGCAAPAFFCEDFENGLKPSYKMDGDAKVAPAGSRGGNALVLTPEGGGKGRLIAENVIPGNNFYGRLYARVAKFPTAPLYSHWVLTEVFETEHGTERVRPLGGQYVDPTNTGGENRWGVGADGGPSGDWTAHEETAPAKDAEWTCLEWQMEDTGTDNVVRVWIDGEAKEKMTQTRKNNGSNKEFVFPKMKNIWFGWWNFQGSTTPKKFDVMIDDIVLSTKRVGCL